MNMGNSILGTETEETPLFSTAKKHLSIFNNESTLRRDGNEDACLHSAFAHTTFCFFSRQMVNIKVPIGRPTACS